MGLADGFTTVRRYEYSSGTGPDGPGRSHLAVQSGVRSPVTNTPGAAQGPGFPSSSLVRTVQRYSVSAANVGPA